MAIYTATAGYLLSPDNMGATGYPYSAVVWMRTEHSWGSFDRMTPLGFVGNDADTGGRGIAHRLYSADGIQVDYELKFSHNSTAFILYGINSTYDLSKWNVIAASTYCTGSGQEQRAYFNETYGSATTYQSDDEVPDQLLIGGLRPGNVRGFEGDIAHAAVWAANLSKFELYLLAVRRWSPLRLTWRRHQLLAYLPLVGGNKDKELIRRNPFSEVSTVNWHGREPDTVVMPPSHTRSYNLGAIARPAVETDRYRPWTKYVPAIRSITAGRTRRYSGWTQSKPINTQFELNQDSPQARGLVACWSPLVSRTPKVVKELVSGNDANAVSTPTMISTYRAGRVIYQDANTDYYTMDGITLSGEYSVSIWFRYDTTKTYNGLLTGVAGLYYSAAGDPHLTVRRGAGRNAIQFINQGGLGKLHHLVIAESSSAGKAWAYLDGHLVQETTDTAGDSRTFDQIGRFWGDALYNLEGLWWDARLYDRKLSFDEAKHIYQNPWDLYRPVVSRYWTAPTDLTGAAKSRRVYSGWSRKQPPNVQFTLNQDSPQAKGLVAWWPTALGQGGNLKDMSGLHHDAATLNGSSIAWQNQGVVGGAIDCAGPDSGDYISMNTPNLQTKYGFWNAGAVTLWFRRDYPDASTEGEFIIHIRYDNQNRIRMNKLTAQNVHRAELNLNGTSQYCLYDSSNKPIPIGEWCLLTMTWNAAEDTLANYLNGEFLESVSGLGTPQSVDPTWIYFGYNTGGAGEVDGAFADIRLYNRYLEPSEVWDMYVNRWDLYRPVIAHAWLAEVPEAYYDSLAYLLGRFRKRRFHPLLVR